MEQFAMGEYGPFVWSCYLLTLVVVVISIVQAKRRHRSVADGIKRGLKAEEAGE